MNKSIACLLHLTLRNNSSEPHHSPLILLSLYIWHRSEEAINTSHSKDARPSITLASMSILKIMQNNIRQWVKGFVQINKHQRNKTWMTSKQALPTLLDLHYESFFKRIQYLIVMFSPGGKRIFLIEICFLFIILHPDYLTI